jgi:hypothetical protein
MVKEQSECSESQMSQDERNFRCRAQEIQLYLVAYREKYNENTESLGAMKAGLPQSIPARSRAEAGAVSLCPGL